MKRWSRFVALSAFLCAGCGSPASSSVTAKTVKSTPTAIAKPTATSSPCDVGPQTAPPNGLAADFATALAFAPDGRLFFAQRSGQLQVWQGGAVHTFASVGTVTTEPGGSYSERGLLGLAISPTFKTDHYVYAFYSDPNYTQQHVIRWTDCAEVSSNPTILVTVPSGSDCCHKGGRIAFGADGKLYVTLGDEHTAGAAQDVADVRGKVLRYNPDGSIPADNPFGATNPVWAYGFRNPFGIAFSNTGQLAITSNGPSGDAGSPGTGYDTVILSVTKGERLQWPLCYGYSHSLQSSNCGGSPPDWSSERSTWVPTGAAFIDSSGPAPYAGHLLFCSDDKGMGIVTPGSPATVTNGPSNCVLDVVQGPDHAVYYSSATQIFRVS
jgi:glucose/arabinose dehydrogenase